MDRRTLITLLSILWLYPAHGQGLRPEPGPIDTIGYPYNHRDIRNLEKVIHYIDPSAEVQLLVFGGVKYIAFSAREKEGSDKAELTIAILNIAKRPETFVTRDLYIPRKTFKKLKALWTRELLNTRYREIPDSQERDGLIYHLASRSPLHNEAMAGYFTSGDPVTPSLSKVLRTLDIIRELAETPHLTPEADNKLIAQLGK